MDPAGTSAMLRETRGLARPARLALETIGLVLATEAIALPLGVLLAILLFRTDLWGRRVMLALIALAAFVPLPLHATAWLGALGNAGRMQAIGVRPILVGRFGAAVVHALAALPWVVLLAGVGLCAVEPELEESARLDFGPWRVLTRVTLRRAVGAIAAAALAVAVLTAGDMTVTDLLQVRTYAEEAYRPVHPGTGAGRCRGGRAAADPGRAGDLDPDRRPGSVAPRPGPAGLVVLAAPGPGGSAAGEFPAEYCWSPDRETRWRFPSTACSGVPAGSAAERRWDSRRPGRSRD